MLPAEPRPAPISIPDIALHDGRPMADSRDVATTFRKEHKRVLQTIRELHCSDNFRRHNFVPFKINDLTGESTSHVLMTKSGFVFLVLGFTGAEPGRFKEAYIEKFDAMEATAANGVGWIPQTFSQALRLAADLAEENARQAEQLAVSAPKAAALDRIADTNGLILPSDAAKALGMGPKEIAPYMIEEAWCFRRAGGRLAARQDKLNARLLDEKTLRVGDKRTEFQVYVTPKGLTRLAQKLGVVLSPEPDLFGPPRLRPALIAEGAAPADRARTI